MKHLQRGNSKCFDRDKVLKSIRKFLIMGRFTGGYTEIIREYALVDSPIGLYTVNAKLFDKITANTRKHGLTPNNSRALQLYKTLNRL